MNDEYWGEPGWSPDGDVDDAGGVPESRGGLGGSGLRPITNGIRADQIGRASCRERV